MSRWRGTLRRLLAIFFVVAGANHFWNPGIYLGMMPSWVLWPMGVNMFTGVAEIAGGIGLLLRPTRRTAGWALITLLIAIFPANVHVAFQGHMPGVKVPPQVLWLRLPFQALFIGWVWWAAVAAEEDPERSENQGCNRH